MSTLVDPRCVELAQKFLEDRDPDVDHIQDLAGQIQITVDDWLDTYDALQAALNPTQYSADEESNDEAMRWEEDELERARR